MNMKLVLSVAFALSICAACSDGDSSEPRMPAVETETLEMKDEGTLPVKYELPLPVLPDSIRKNSASYQVEQAIEHCSKETEFVLCVCGNVRGLRVFPFDGKKYVCPN